MTRRRRWPNNADEHRRTAITENQYADTQLEALTVHLRRTINDSIAELHIERARRAIHHAISVLRLARGPDREE